MYISLIIGIIHRKFSKKYFWNGIQMENCTQLKPPIDRTKKLLLYIYKCLKLCTLISFSPHLINILFMKYPLGMSALRANMQIKTVMSVETNVKLVFSLWFTLCEQKWAFWNIDISLRQTKHHTSISSSSSHCPFRRAFRTYHSANETRRYFAIFELWIFGVFVCIRRPISHGFCALFGYH